MCQAARRVFAKGGGIVLMEKEKTIFEYSLPVGGMMCPEPFSTVAREMTRLTRMFEKRGFRFGDLLYSQLFMICDFLPDLKMTPVGLFRVKERAVLRPAERIG